jgi:hypothetical protein
VIAQVAILAIVTLMVTHQALVAYFDGAVRDEQYRKVGGAKPEALISVRADERQRLSSIDNAMQMIEAKGRMGASPDIMPSASRDIAPLQGWSKMPGEVPPPMTATPVVPPPASSGDAGASVPPNAPDAAAPKPAGSGVPKQP